jgi:hypothetical protein
MGYPHVDNPFICLLLYRSLFIILSKQDYQIFIADVPINE